MGGINIKYFGGDPMKMVMDIFCVEILAKKLRMGLSMAPHQHGCCLLDFTEY